MPASSSQFLPRRSALAATLALGVPGARAASFPDGPIRLLVPHPPGTDGEQAARSLARALQARLEVPLVIEHRSGAGAEAVARAVAAARADGYTLLHASADTLGIASHHPAVGCDPLHDLAPVALAGENSATWFGIFAPGGTPSPVVGRLNAAINDALDDPGVADALRQQGLEPGKHAARALSARLAAEPDRIGQAITRLPLG